MIYAKIIDSKNLEFLPDSMNYNGTFYSPVPDFVRDNLGYLPYEHTDAPEITEEDKHAEFEYRAIDGTITEVWTIVNDSPETICARLRQYLNDTDKYYIQFSEGDRSAADYEEYKLARQAARERIRELENN